MGARTVGRAFSAFGTTICSAEELAYDGCSDGTQIQSTPDAILDAWPVSARVRIFS